MISTVMSNDSFRKEYSTAIEEYLVTGSESALVKAYELGRKALDTGQLILGVARLHYDVLLSQLGTAKPEEQTKIIADAATFLIEFLSPFEMTFRGFLEAVSNLRIEISERQRAEEALKQSESYFKSLIENTLDVVTIIDMNGNFKYSSPSSERVFGYSPNKLAGRNFFEFVHPDDIDPLLDVFRKGTNAGELSSTLEFRFKHSGGFWIALESLAKNLLGNPLVEGVILNSRDITDRRNLEEIRRKYEFIANASRELMALVNSDYQFEGVNEAYCVAFAKNREEIVGKRLPETLGDEALYKILKVQIDKCFEGTEVRYEGWLRMPGTGRRFMEIDCYPYKNLHLAVTHVVVSLRDATKRKRNEDDIRRSQRQLAEAQRIAHIGSWQWTPSTGMVMCSEELCNMLGLPASFSEISFRDFLTYTVPEERSKFEETISGSLNPENPFIIEHRIIRPDGSGRIFQTRGEAIVDEGVSVGLIGTSQDVTERELAQQAIRASEAKYRRLFEASKEGILLLNAETGRIIDINTFVIGFLGYQKDDFLGRRLWEIKAINGIPVTQDAFREVVKKESVRFDELELETSSRKRVKVDFVSITYCVEKDKVIQCHLWDITERKLLQEELNDAARQRAEDLRRFARSTQDAQEEERRRISRELHDDICQRLTALGLHMNVFEDSVETQKKISLKQLRSVKKEINNLISEVRAISYNLRPSALDHFGLVTSLHLLASEFEKSTAMQIQFATDVQPHQRYDPEIEIAFYRIAQEALTNSSKHSKASTADLNLTEKGNALFLTISDDGAGFDLDTYPKMMAVEKHFGLMNMRERTEMLGGTFQIDSSRGNGTTVNVSVPLRAKDEDRKN